MPHVVIVHATVPTEDPDATITAVKAALRRLDPPAGADEETAEAPAPAPIRWQVAAVRREAATTGVWRPS